ncbi:MAG: (d)CMP kinase [Eubacteriales bacterium]
MSNNKNNKKIQIAVDGPAGAGKSSVSREVAEILNIEYLDTGAMYRATAYFMLINNVDIKNEQALSDELANLKIDYTGGFLCLNGKEIADEIRSAEVTRMASDVSALPPVRAKLVALQRDIAKTGSIILDGRDIGTNVLPDAQLKIFLTATPEARATRRYEELREKGSVLSYEQILEEIKIRDEHDENRKLNPLRCADDAIVVDSSDMSKEEVIEFVVNKAKALMEN